MRLQTCFSEKVHVAAASLRENFAACERSERAGSEAGPEWAARSMCAGTAAAGAHHKKRDDGKKRKNHCGTASVGGGGETTSRLAEKKRNSTHTHAYTHTQRRTTRVLFCGSS